MKLLYFGDVHARGTNPRNRTDVFKDALKLKLREIFSIARARGVKALICAGDIFDRPEVTNSVLLEFAEVFKESPVPIYTTAGNHDIYGYNLDTYERTSLRIMEMIVPQLIVVNDPNENIFIVDDANSQNAVSLSFQPYNQNIDKDGYGYSPGNPGKGYKIHTAHGMLLDHTPPFDRFTLIKDVETEADLVLTGHDHIGYGHYKRSDGKDFVNCGAICRLSASKGEIERQIKVALIEIEENLLSDIQLIALKSAKPGEEVLDRSQIEAEKKRQYAMEEFASLIQGKDGSTAAVDINAIIEAIAGKEGYNPKIVDIALEKIQEAREGAKA